MNSQIRGLRLDLGLFVAAAVAAKVAWDAASEDESSHRRFSTLIGDTQAATEDTKKLSEAASQESFKASEYLEAASSLSVAGVATENLTSVVSELGKASRVSNIPFKDLVKVSEELQE